MFEVKRYNKKAQKTPTLIRNATASELFNYTKDQIVKAIEAAYTEKQQQNK